MLLIDSVAMTLLVYWSVRNDRRSPGQTEEGWFRMADPEADTAPKPKPKAKPNAQARPRARSHW
jgi:hypothetical protein